MLRPGDKVTVGTTIFVLCDEHTALRDLTTTHPSAVAGVEVEEFQSIANQLMGRDGKHSAGHHHHHHHHRHHHGRMAGGILHVLHWLDLFHGFGTPSDRPG